MSTCIMLNYIEQNIIFTYYLVNLIIINTTNEIEQENAFNFD